LKAKSHQKRDLHDFIDVADDSESEKSPFHFIQLNAAGTHQTGNHTHHLKGNHTHHLKGNHTLTGAGKGGKGGKAGKGGKPRRHGGHKPTTLSA